MFCFDTDKPVVSCHYFKTSKNNITKSENDVAKISSQSEQVKQVKQWPQLVWNSDHKSSNLLKFYMNL